MGTFFACSIQSAICLVMFYLFYKVLLGRETFHRFNRMALLGILFLSIIIPFTLDLLPIRQVTAIQPEIPGIVEESQISSGNRSDRIVNNETGNTMLALLLSVYLTGCAVCMIYTLLSTFRIFRIINKGTCISVHNGTKLIILNDRAISPFSWMRYIVCSASDYEEAGDTIIAHENTHIRLYHSADLFVAQACIIIQWFNPVAWLLYKELQNIHEYEADGAVIHEGFNAKQYQLLLIKKAVGTRRYSMANSLNHSNLKKRITMMIQKKSNPWARLKYAYVLPLAATAVALFAQPEVSQSFDGISNAKVSHFSFEKSKNEVKNLPETEISEIPPILSVDVTPNEFVIAEDTTIYQSAEIMPSFPGGDKALMKWISENMNYPKEAHDKGDQGRVYCQFVIEKDGSVSNVEIMRGASNPLLNEEAVRTLKNLPKFKPGETKGGCVRVRFTVPVLFQIESNVKVNEKQSQIDRLSEVSASVEKEIVWQDFDDNHIFKSAEIMPAFPGGEAALKRWIKDHMNYPKEVKDKGDQGRIYCQFVIEKDGSVSNVEIMRGASNPLLNEEAVRTLKTLPKFKPGEIKGERVRVYFSMPVLFQLESSEGLE